MCNENYQQGYIERNAEEYEPSVRNYQPAIPKKPKCASGPVNSALFCK